MEPNPVSANVEVQVLVEAASHESVSALSGLELSSTSNSGRSSSNLSPAGTGRSISSPNLSDQISLPIDQNHVRSESGNVSVPAPPQFLPPSLAMASLQQEGGAHFLLLQQLKKSDKGHQRDASTHKKRVRRLSKEMYVLVSTYALLQGVLFVAVAQSSHSAFMCEDWRWLAVMGGGVTLAMLWSVVDKLRQMGIHKAQAEKSERCQSAVYDKIQLLYSHGSACPIDGNLEPQRSGRDLPSCSSVPSCSALLCLRGLLVLGFLVGFSVLNIASCICMLCHSN